MRYFDHIQAQPAVRANAEQFAVVHVDLENAPAVARKAEPPKKKEKLPGTVETVKGAAVDAAASVKAKTTELVEGNTAKKEKREKVPKAEESGKKKGGAAPKAAVAEDAGDPVPSMIDLRVGHIVDSMSQFRLDL
jgi:aminoacyl tRNA synthase complex-interacting multifunctional protein 1